MQVSLGNNIDWVGCVDWTIRDFHGYATNRGSSYNAYLIRDEQIALIDTVKAPFAAELLQSIAELTPLDKVDWVVCNHAEPDHAGALPEVLAALPNATLVCTEKCRQVLSQHTDTASWKIRILAPTDTLCLGSRTLEFIQTPLAHWPESMFTYSPQDKVLFSMDAFGQHFASAHRFDDQNDLSTLLDEAKTYYANILMPFGGPTGKALAAAGKLAINTIAPSHGVIWRTHLPAILEAYQRWTTGAVEEKVVILYDSMWQSTEMMAHAICEGALSTGIEVKLIHIRQSDLTHIAEEILDAAAIAVGSPTLNTGLMPMMGAALTYLQGLKAVGKVGFAFGSSGWSRGGAEAVHAYLEAMKWEILCDPIRSQYRPTPEVLEACHAAGVQLAKKALKQS